jgi:hypothetical protein
VDVRLEEDSHVVEELWWVFEFAASHALLWHNVGDNGAARQLALSSSPRWWWCSVELRAFVCVGCTLRRVMYECFFFLYDMTMLLPLIFLKKLSALVFLSAGIKLQDDPIRFCSNICLCRFVVQRKTWEYGTHALSI